MDGTGATDSPLESAGGAVGPHTVDAFRLLSNETRLAIMVALWEQYDPHDADDAVTFSELCDRVGVRDSGNFNYHLEKLVGHFVAETDDGYRLRSAGRKIVQATIAGAGLEERTLPPTEIDMSCPRCGAPVEISYENEHLYHTCTACEGNTGPDFAQERPAGTLMMFDFDPAGLANRTPEDVFVAGTIKALRDFGLLIRGICPACSGPIEESLHVCESHQTTRGRACPTCGTSDEVRVSYVCSVCKHGDSYPAHAAVYDHPAVVAFCARHGIETTYALDDPEACCELWDHLLEREYTLASEDPVRVRISVPGDGETLHLTLDRHLAVIDVTEEAREMDRDASDEEDCLRYLRRQRWPDGVTCPHCDSPDTIKKGTTSKGTQRYRCHACDRIFNDLTGTVFAGHRLSLQEMFHIVRTMDGTGTTRIARRLDRSHRSVLNFVREVRDARERGSEPLSLSSVPPPTST